MEEISLFNYYSNHLHLQNLQDAIVNNDSRKIKIAKLAGSSRSLFIQSLTIETGKDVICIMPDKETAAYLFNDLENLQTRNLYFFPTSYKRSILYGQEDPTNQIMRTESLNALVSGKKSIIISYPEAIAEKVVSREYVTKNSLKIHRGEEISIDFLHEVMQEYGFQLVDFVFEPGQYAMRGSILDIYSYSNDLPYRIDFFGDEVETIRSFDIENQLSLHQLEEVTILPQLQNPEEGKQGAEKISFFDFLHESPLIVAEDNDFIADSLEELNRKLEEEKSKKTDGLIISSSSFKHFLSESISIEFGRLTKNEVGDSFVFNTNPQPVFNKNFELLAENISEYQELGYKTLIISNNSKQIERLQAIFDEIRPGLKIETLEGTIHEGFIEHDYRLCCYTDHQIFERYHKFRLKANSQKKGALTLREINQLHPGDYVVHIDHGIGKFGGLEKITINGKQQEAIKLVYRDRDTLYVSIHALHKISKYKGKDAEPPRIYKLGTGAWQNLKKKTKQKVKDIAKDLIHLYAKRKAQKGFAYSADTYLQRELESSFIYEDTPDQNTTTQLVKEDMENSTPMDRLVCGDVGFGKTEIAVRAAFKAVTDNKQVALLVPTTILALQHYNTFKERLKDFPCNIDYISRLRTAKAQTQIKKKLTEGKLDIIIGTHRLVGKDLNFKDLGLLIVDEEQKFGVSVKEKLKKLKVNVDTLTLTATPIPRTLQFSMMGARDLSIINTPPPNRYPIVTELHSFNEDIIKEAIDYEFQRNGQVFFINNRIQNIEEIASLVRRIHPEVRVVVAHGQMEGPKLEKIMMDFINYEYDVLIATTIIESGLDIPNTNTIIINDAHHFGLSDLHQLRGRVGRSNRKAFCYLLAPPTSHMTPEARRRLKAIEEFSELGSGFNIAMQDLDIRGAGNLLGAEQSGFITDIGFETYQRILDEAMQELKEHEFKDLYQEEKKKEEFRKIQRQQFLKDAIIDTDLELLFPENYISNISERIRLYRILDNIKSEDELIAFENELKDRFGKIPEPSIELMNVVRVRWLCINLGFEKLILKQNKLVLHFISDQESPYYQSEIFVTILKKVQEKSRYYQMKESKDKLRLVISDVKSINQVLSILQQFTISKPPKIA